MAAVVCKGCFDCCTGACSACGKCCGGLCEGCCGGLESCCRTVEDACCGEKPFPMCATFTCLVNVMPMFLFFIFAGLQWDNGCSGNAWQLPVFLIVEGILCILNMLFAVYIYWRFSLKPDDKQNAFERGFKILCYDPVVCLYFILYVFELVWQFVGIAWVAGSSCPSADSGLFAVSVVAIIVMLFFLSLGGIVAICSVCCQGVKEGARSLSKK